MAGNNGIDGVKMSSGTGHKSKLVEIGSKCKWLQKTPQSPGGVELQLLTAGR